MRAFLICKLTRDEAKDILTKLGSFQIRKLDR
jgi:hypothetical protein